MSAETPWYAAGLRFTCARCHDCCHKHGEHRYVWVTPEDCHAMAAALGLAPERFAERYLVEVEETEGEAGGEPALSLRFDEELCPLHDGAGCRVYDARPSQCRTWPFWPEHLESEGVWHDEALLFCPGCRDPRGALHSAAEVEALAEQNDFE